MMRRIIQILTLGLDEHVEFEPVFCVRLSGETLLFLGALYFRSCEEVTGYLRSRGREALVKKVPVRLTVASCEPVSYVMPGN